MSNNALKNLPIRFKFQCPWDPHPPSPLKPRSQKKWSRPIARNLLKKASTCFKASRSGSPRSGRRILRDPQVICLKLNFIFSLWNLNFEWDHLLKFEMSFQNRGIVVSRLFAKPCWNLQRLKCSQLFTSPDRQTFFIGQCLS